MTDPVPHKRQKVELPIGIVDGSHRVLRAASCIGKSDTHDEN
jgi:hypothetical protein